MSHFIKSNIEIEASTGNLESFKKIYHIYRTSQVKKWLWGSLLLLIVILWLPWTQSIRAKGSVTTLKQDQRPQELNAMIAGKVMKWHIKEGDFVKKGDTILQLGEVKMEYLDPKLLERTKEQLNAKETSIKSYEDKVLSVKNQIVALREGMLFKMKSIDNKVAQQYLKLNSDSTDLLAVINELSVYKRQLDAAKIMLDSGSISLSEFEKRKLNFQNAQAKKNNTENKVLQSRQEINNLSFERDGIIQDYKDKIAKAEGEAAASLSNVAGAQAELAKLQNLYANYDARNQLYYVLAPQSGQVIKAKKAGIGEMVKEGEMIVAVIPDQIQYAVELYVDPMDLPLVSIGQKVRFVFDGFPAIVFSGWPAQSYGTFGGTIAAIETDVSDNGKFRVLVKEDDADKHWPRQLKMGSGASGIALLKDVRIYYELWRNINGFPPEYYAIEDKKKKKNEAY